MITITKNERDARVASAEATLMAKASNASFELKKGVGIEVLSKSLKVALASLEALEGYATGEYQPEEFFNVISPDNFHGIYRNTDTINNGLN